jgi:hypothetical protein
MVILHSYTASALLLAFLSQHTRSPSTRHRIWQPINGQEGVLESCSRPAMRYPEIPVLSVIAAVLLLVLLPSQWRSRNIPTLTLILSTFLEGIVNVVNTLVWNGNTRNVAPVWCDFGQIVHLPIHSRPLTQRTHNL